VQILGQLRIRLKQKRSQLAASTHNGNTTLRGGSQGGVAHSGVVAERIENDVRRMKGTSHLLIWVGIMFCVCWLPLNVINTVRERERDIPAVMGVGIGAWGSRDNQKQRLKEERDEQHAHLGLNHVFGDR
jgi:hypothetical protein